MASSNSNSLPPNHLGSNVPEGFSVDFAKDQNNNTSNTSKDQDKMTEPNSTVQNASADNVDEGKFGEPGLLDPARSGSASSATKVSQLRGSRASISAPTKERVFNPHAQNPGRIPTAGGVAVGSKQSEARRASRVSGDMGQGGASAAPVSPPLPEEANGKPEEKPTFNMPDYSENTAPDASAPDASAQASGGAEKDVTPASATAPATGTGEGVDVATGATPTTTTTDANADKPVTEKVKETVQEKTPNLSAAGSSSSPTSPQAASPSKERRASRFDAFKDKLGLGSKK